MQKDYILEIESSETECPKIVYQQSQRQGRWLGKQPKKEKNDSIEKYVRFTVKKTQPISVLNLGMVGKLVTGIVLTVLLFHTLSEVDPARKIIDIIYRVFKVTPGVSAINVAGEDSMKRSFIRGVMRSLEKIGVTRYRKGESRCPSILDLVYFIGAAKFTDWIFWQVDNDIEESILIIPGLGVQCESVILKRSLAVLGLRLALALVKMIVDKAAGAISLLQGKLQSRLLKKEQTGRARELSISRKQMDRLLSLEKALAKCDRMVLSREFIPMEYVKDLIINEGFVKFQVMFYLALITKSGTDRGVKSGEPSDNAGIESGDQSDGLGIQPAGNGEALKMMVVFPHLLPRRKLLETVWRRSRRFIER